MLELSRLPLFSITEVVGDVQDIQIENKQREKIVQPLILLRALLNLNKNLSVSLSNCVTISISVKSGNISQVSNKQLSL